MNSPCLSRSLFLFIFVAATISHAEERRVPSLFTQVRNLNAKADPIGANRGAALDRTQLCKHYQGIARSEVAGTPYFFLTANGNKNSNSCPFEATEAGELVVIQMGSRDTDGERLRSNRLARGSRFNDTPPNPADQAVVSIRFDGVSVDANGNTWPNWAHLGSCQLIDNVLFVPVEYNLATNDPDGGGIVLVDVSNPISPMLIKNIDLNEKIGTVGVTRDPADNRYLVALGGAFIQDDGLVFMKSTGTTLDSSFTLDNSTLYTWSIFNDPDPSDVPIWDEDQWQFAGFVRDADGTLAMITMSDSSLTSIGIGRLRLWQVIESDGTYDLDWWTSKNQGMEEPTTGDMDAAAGVYVSPTGQLIIYVAEHLSNGPDDSIRMGEFRNFDMNVPSDAGCEGWVNLYENVEGWNANASQSYAMDFVDYALENWDDLRDFEDHIFDINGFSDEAESLRWNIPPGRYAAIYKNENFGGAAYFLDGNGRVMSISDLNSIGFGDEITSIRFIDRTGDMYVGFNRLGCQIPSGFGINTCPYVGPTSIQDAADNIGAPPCFAARSILLEAGTDTQNVHIDRHMTLRAVGGPARIVGQ